MLKSIPDAALVSWGAQSYRWRAQVIHEQADGRKDGVNEGSKQDHVVEVTGRAACLDWQPETALLKL